MENSPYEKPLEETEFGSERRKAGLLRLGIQAMFETQMNLADSGQQTREQALARIATFRAEITSAQEAV